MALPASGAITFANVNTELSVATTTQRTLNDSAVRTLFAVPSGAISMSNGHGKSAMWYGYIAVHQANMNLRTWALANGWTGSGAATITVNAGIYVYSTGTGTPAMTIDGTWPAGLTLVNNGNIIGMGGKGATAVDGSGVAGSAGGPAISLGVSCTIQNNGYIAGGGGGGGSGGYDAWLSGGGGAGGGAGGGGAAGGGLGAAGAAGAVSNWQDPYGPTYENRQNAGGGGRVLPGAGGGRGAGGGAGGGGGSYLYDNGSGGADFRYGGAGGSGSGAGGGGTGGSAPYYGGGGGGGGWGASGGAGGNGGGGAGGKCVALNGFTITWAIAGNRYGAIS